MPSSHLASDAVEGQNVVSLPQSGVGVGGTVCHGFIITKHTTGGMHFDSQVSEGVPQVCNLLNARPPSCEFCAMCCGIQSGLFLGLPHDWCLVGKVKATHDGFSQTRSDA